MVIWFLYIFIISLSSYFVIFCHILSELFFSSSSAALRRTSTASSQAKWASPDLNGQLPSRVGTAGPHKAMTKHEKAWKKRKKARSYVRKNAGMP